VSYALSDPKVTPKKNRFPAESQFPFRIFPHFPPYATQDYSVFNKYYSAAIVLLLIFANFSRFFKNNLRVIEK
jgi:hypothetical protein